MSSPRVLITSRIVDAQGPVVSHLRAAGVETVIDYGTGKRTEAELLPLITGMDGAIVGLDPFTPRVFDTADRLKVVVRTGVGFDAIDVQAATARGVFVCNTPGANRHAVAEYTIALLLQCSRKMAENLAEVPRKGWTRRIGRDLAGATLGIVGLGTIGKEVARRASAFEMRILACDPVPAPEFAERYGVSYATLEELLPESDYVTLHLFLDATTRHLINAERLALMKPSAYLINTARGPIVDTEALYEALQGRRIAGAALDVFDEEPLRDSPLRQLDNIYLSPHAAAMTYDANLASGMMAAEEVLRVLRGEAPLHPVG